MERTQHSWDDRTPALVIFDAYNTLVTTRPGYKDTFLDGLAQTGLTPSSSVLSRLQAAGEGLDHSEFSLSRTDYLEWATETLRMVRLHGEVADDYAPRVVPALEQLHQAPMMPLPGARWCLSQLRGTAGIIVAVCSNWGWDLRSDLRSSCLADDVDLIVTSAEVGYRKPRPEIYQAVLDMAGVSADQAVFIGDTVNTDILGPESAGIHPILLAPSPVPGFAGTTIRSLSELLPILIIDSKRRPS